MGPQIIYDRMIFFFVIILPSYFATECLLSSLLYRNSIPIRLPSPPLAMHTRVFVPSQYRRFRRWNIWHARVFSSGSLNIAKIQFDLWSTSVKRICSILRYHMMLFCELLTSSYLPFTCPDLTFIHHYWPRWCRDLSPDRSSH